ncbi:HAMP domain-containing sensor histidine kinase [Polyangium jinanense]|uniref:histidine kinase n=1 Tax=Polyangium jinanense TaxID=2829994 RepID=A0A9X4ASC2_9BACT|nr:HAMP domain-containing sensor histidine kinase [Polyangium jinanense]MDC3955714.1 HAMP domain-containing histidine kinase [Polyangium jinanense]MDC3982356.1 HAMP domain-containing histidine kinase [Polyangium jinanense]
MDRARPTRWHRIRPLRLSRLLSLAIAALSFLVILSAVSLFLSTAVLHRNTERLDAAMMGAGLARDVELELLHYGRLVEHAVARDGVEPDEQRKAVLQAVQARLSEAEAHVGSDMEKQVLGELSKRTATYFTARDRLEKAGVPLGQALQQTQIDYDDALAKAAELVTINLADAAQARKSATFWDDALDTVSVIVISGLLLLVLALVQGARSQIYVPLSALRRAIERFARGDDHTRAPDVGPVEIRELAAAFNEMAASIARKREEQIAVLAAVAHDIRNPLAAIKMSTTVLARSAPSTEPRVLRTLTIVDRQIDRLARMTDDLLQATRIQAGQLELSKKPCDLCQILNDSVELYASTSPNHRISLVIPEGTLVCDLDQARVEQVLDNLIGNAIKYSPTGGEIRIAANGDGNEAVVAVSDQGVGIEPEEIERIFEPFHRAVSTRKVAHGVGLGLSVARKIIEAHGGRVEVESRRGEGTTFRVHLPLLRHASIRRSA